MIMDYKKHALETLTNWLHDCVSCEEIDSQEIYDTIKEVIEDNYKVYNNLATKCKDLMNMISVDNPDYFKYEMSVEDNLIKLEKSPTTYDEMISAGYEMTDDGFWISTNKKWTVPVEKDSTNDEYFFTLPEELVEKLSWKEGDEVEYIDNGDGSFLIKKTVSELST